MAKKTIAPADLDLNNSEPAGSASKTTKKKTKRKTRSKAASDDAGATKPDAPAKEAPAKTDGGDKPKQPKQPERGEAVNGQPDRPQQKPQQQQQQGRGDRDHQNRENRDNRGGGGGGGHQHNQGGGGGRNKQRKKKRRKGGQGGGGLRQPSFSIPAGALPSDHDLDREAEEMRGRVSDKEYKEAEKNALFVADLQRMKLAEIHELAAEEGVEEVQTLPRVDLIFEVLKKRAEASGVMFGEGSLEIMHEGFGFLRSPEASYIASPDDIYVAPATIRRLGLRKGMEVRGAIRPPKEGEKFFALLTVDKVNGREPDVLKTLPIFEDLTPLHPSERFVLETTPDIIETRVIDLVAPIGRGQRGLIVAPPRTGKTVLLQRITQAISQNYDDAKIIVLLIDERPEEVTDFKRHTEDSVEVVASTFDEDSSRHVQVAEMVMEKARRHVEFGDHVVILLDSITRLARAYNAAQPHSGKIMTGGIDSNALIRPKKFFGSARAIEDGGSLTILGTALVDTGSRADEVIFEEFKGTGNSELHLDRKLVEKRVWPAIDIAASGTRREELLMDPKELELIYRLRKVLSDMNVVEAMELVKSRLKKTKTNAEFLMTMNMG